MEGFTAVASAVIALLALGVSIAVAVNQARIAREQTTIQERLAAIDEARRVEEVAARTQARVIASIRFASLAEPELVLHNEGLALARGVQAEVESLDGNPLPIFEGIDVLPEDLQPGQPITFQIIGASGDADTVRVTVCWTDEAGDHEEPWTLRIRY
jgi:hypothetical protein